MSEWKPKRNHNQVLFEDQMEQFKYELGCFLEDWSAKIVVKSDQLRLILPRIRSYSGGGIQRELSLFNTDGNLICGDAARLVCQRIDENLLVIPDSLAESIRGGES